MPDGRKDGKLRPGKGAKTKAKQDGIAKGAAPRVPYQIFVDIRTFLRVERLLGIRTQDAVLSGGSRNDVSANGLFLEGVETVLDREEAARDLDRTHPLPAVPEGLCPRRRGQR